MDNKLLDHSLSRIAQRGLEKYLSSLQRGLEKESLRVAVDGKLAQTPHPRALGSAMTHPSITTDYSEALLEFVTPIHTSVEELLQELHDIHQYTYLNIGDEKLWVNSMPCVVESEEKIPIARYGFSNVAKMKEAYRRGLGHRYGRLMQTIAGIHFNFSLQDGFWDEYLDFSDEAERVAQKSANYFTLTRNFLRHSWLLCYLFGASPAVCKTFLQGRQHNLDEHDDHSFYSPYATSLRLSGLGYSSNAQLGINVCYNTLDEYADTLLKAIQTPHPEYQDIELIVGGKYQQLNPNLLQIENEFYAVVRPKVVAKSGESPARALKQRGVDYVEVRSLDLNPYVPIGIDAECIRFFDIVMLHCLFGDQSNISEKERAEATENRQRAVMQGRKPGLTLSFDGKEVAFADAANSLLDQFDEVAALLDGACGGNAYRESLASQRIKIEDPNQTASAKILAELDNGFDGFYSFAMSKAEQHAEYFKQGKMDSEKLYDYQEQALKSHKRQEELEESDEVAFDAFLEDYVQRQNAADS